MEITKGKWEVGTFNPLSNLVVYVQEGEELWERKRIADCYDNEGDAYLIAAAVNACIKINPDNPLAVAESITDLYEALKAVLDEPDEDRAAAMVLEAIAEADRRE